MPYQANPISGGWTEDEKKKALANLLYISTITADDISNETTYRWAWTQSRSRRLKPCGKLIELHLLGGTEGPRSLYSFCDEIAYVCRVRGQHRHANGAHGHYISPCESNADDLDHLLAFRATALRPAVTQALADPLRRLVEDYRRARGLDRKMARGRLVAEARRLVPGILRAYPGGVP